MQSKFEKTKPSKRNQGIFIYYKKNRTNESVPSQHEAGTAVCVWQAPLSFSPPGAVSEYPPASGDHSDGCLVLRMGRPAKICQYVELQPDI